MHLTPFIYFCTLLVPVFSKTILDPETTNGLASLSERLLQEPVHQPEVYTRAVQILEAIESCHRLATVDLIDSCQELEPSITAEVSLASIRETFAARLAMCELSSANFNIPSQCERFVPTAAACQQNSRSSKLLRILRTHRGSSKSMETTCYPHATPSHTQQCLGTLHSRPQWWTSYSNALQNVLIVCQAGRNAIEKGRSMILLFCRIFLTDKL